MNIRVSTSTHFDDGRFRSAMMKSANAGLTAGAVSAAGFMKAGIKRGPRYGRATAGGTPQYRTGHMYRSIHAQASTALKSAAGSNAAQARIQETGGVIRPRSGRAIPVPVNIPAQNLQERFAGQTFSTNGGYTKTGSLRQLNLTFIRRPGKPPILVGKSIKVERNKGNKNHTVFAQGIPVWVLVPSVRIPPRPWCKPAVEQNAAAISKAITDRAVEVFSRAIGGGA